MKLETFLGGLRGLFDMILDSLRYLLFSNFGIIQDSLRFQGFFFFSL